MAKVVSAKLLQRKLMDMQCRTYMHVPYIQTPYNHDVNNMAQYMSSVISQEVARHVDLAMKQMLMDMWNAVQESTIDSGCIICREPSEHERERFSDVIEN